jgi:hypothetical protein
VAKEVSYFLGKRSRLAVLRGLESVRPLALGAHDERPRHDRLLEQRSGLFAVAPYPFMRNRRRTMEPLPAASGPKRLWSPPGAAASKGPDSGDSKSDLARSLAGAGPAGRARRGHFDGSTVLHWAGGAGGRGALLPGDTFQVAPDRKQNKVSSLSSRLTR